MHAGGSNLYLHKSLFFSLYAYLFEAGSHYIAQVDLELKMLPTRFLSAGITGVCHQAGLESTPSQGLEFFSCHL